MPMKAPRVAPPISTGQHETTLAAPMASLAIGHGTVDSHDAARPISHRRRRRSRLFNEASRKMVISM
jgi:hypothetical protein